MFAKVFPKVARPPPSRNLFRNLTDMLARWRKGQKKAYPESFFFKQESTVLTWSFVKVWCA